MRFEIVRRQERFWSRDCSWNAGRAERLQAAARNLDLGRAAVGHDGSEVAEVRQIRAAGMSESSPAVIPADQTGDLFAARLRGFGPLGILAIIIILGGNFVFAPLSAILVF